MDNIMSVENQCTGCAACAAICPAKAITLGKDKYGFYYPEVDEKLCNGCGLCKKKCHVCRDEREKNVFDLKDGQKYYAYSKNETIRRRSSSGGVFTHISQVVPNAVVIGAAYVGDDNTLKHTAEDISRLRRSKYTESCMEDTEKLICDARKYGKTVVFCGTPCQTASVRTLHPNDPDILLVDFVCHGVPSMQFLNDHIAKIEKEKGKKIVEANFRSKTAGWSKQGVLYYYDDGTKEFFPHVVDSYMFGFYKSITLRSSCYSCAYAHRSCADITLADFWGVFNYDSKLNDDKGLSLVIVNTEKGKSLFSSISEKIVYQKLENDAVEYIFKDHDYSEGLSYRKEFLKRYEKHGFDNAMAKYFKNSYRKSKIKAFIKSLIK